MLLREQVRAPQGGDGAQGSLRGQQGGQQAPPGRPSPQGLLAAPLAPCAHPPTPPGADPREGVTVPARHLLTICAHSPGLPRRRVSSSSTASQLSSPHLREGHRAGQVGRAGGQALPSGGKSGEGGVGGSLSQGLTL